MLEDLYREEKQEDYASPPDPNASDTDQFRSTLENRATPITYSYWTFFYLFLWD